MDNDIFYLCKYKVDSLIFTLNDQKLEMDPTNILVIEYLCDYESNYRAVLKISLRMDIRKKLWLLANKRDIVCKFELCSIGTDIDVEEYITSKKQAINETFGVYFNDEDESIDVGDLCRRLKINEDSLNDLNVIDNENYYESQNALDIYLYNKTLLNASNNMYNGIMTSGTIQQYVGRILTKTKHKNVLISKFENGEVYKELLVPALPAYKALSYLDQYYGFYKVGSIIFYDVDYLYILNPNGKVTAKRKNEWTKTIFMTTTMNESIPGHGMMIKENEKTSYVMTPEDNVNLKKFSIMSNVNIGSEAKIITVDGIDIKTIQSDQEYIDQRNQVMIQQLKDDNKFSSDMIKRRLEENEITIYISGDNYDIKAFTPNREFNIVFNDQSKQTKYGKFNYRIAYMYTIIKTEGEEYMNSSHRIILKKIPK